MNPFRTVSLGRTKVQITQLGFGTAALGWLYSPVAEAGAVELVQYAYTQGCTFFDTSPLYGGGLAEAPLGAALTTGRAVIHLPNSNDLTIIGKYNDAERVYIQRIERNGTLYTRTVIDYADLMCGGTLQFVLGSSPHVYEVAADNLLFSFSTASINTTR